MFRRFWRWLSSRFETRPARTKPSNRFDAIIEDAQTEVAMLIERYRKERRAA
jgi:hypothetical protein